MKLLKNAGAGLVGAFEVVCPPLRRENSRKKMARLHNVLGRLVASEPAGLKSRWEAPEGDADGLGAAASFYFTFHVKDNECVSEIVSHLVSHLNAATGSECFSGLKMLSR